MICWFPPSNQMDFEFGTRADLIAQAVRRTTVVPSVGVCAPFKVLLWLRTQSARFKKTRQCIVKLTVIPIEI